MFGKQMSPGEQLELAHNSTFATTSKRTGEMSSPPPASHCDELEGRGVFGLKSREQTSGQNYKDSKTRKLSQMIIAKTTSTRRRAARVSTSGRLVALAGLCQLLALLLLAPLQLVAANNKDSSLATDQLIRQAFPHQPLSQEALSFDGAQFKSIYEAIRAHPDLREFAGLCEAKGVKEIVSMDKIALTVFAPIDKSLGDLLIKSKSRSINLIELAKHHIAQGFVMPNDNLKYPHQFQSYALLSPLYLSQAAAAPATPTSSAAGPPASIHVNNAKILASYLIPIDQDTFQTLHLIDEPLEFAYVNRRAQLRNHAAAQASAGGASSSGSGATAQSGASQPLPASRQQQFVATVKRPVSLEDLLTGGSGSSDEAAGAILEFAERFGDLVSQQPQVDLYHARALSGAGSSPHSPSQWQRLSLVQSRDQLDFGSLGRKLGALTATATPLRGRLNRLNESNSLNTYFLPVNNEELEQLLEGGNLQELDLVLQAHVIPDQVLFTRAMGLGQTHSSLLDKQPSHQQSVSLSLAKQIPPSVNLNELLASGGHSGDHQLESERLLSSPLLLQARCAPAGAATDQPGDGAHLFRNGLTQSEVLLANIPLANGVLHLIRRPILAQATNLLNFINDNDHQLSNFVQSLGSQSGPLVPGQALAEGRRTQPVELNRFRELLVRDRQLLATFSNDLLHSNRTLLAPTDEAFARLRFDLRALIFGDELLVPAHWDPSYRADLLERLMKRHLITEQTLTSDLLLATGSTPYLTSSSNGQLLSFRRVNQDSATGNQQQQQQIQVDCDATSGRLIHQDLIGTNGVLHVIDRVLGEEQETIHSLMRSFVLRLAGRLQQEQAQATPLEELAQLVEQALRQFSGPQQDLATTTGSGADSDGQAQEQRVATTHRKQAGQQQQQLSPELNAISKTVGQFLDVDLGPQKRQLLGSSVNVSFHLAKLVSRAESRDDWNEKFAQLERAFTYFVPNDLAWLRLIQVQPELYKPLMYFLDQQQQAPALQQQQQNGEQTAVQGLAANSLPRSSESSHRLLQILERHLIGNRKLTTRELNQLGQVQTVGATLRLVEATHPNQLTVAPADGTAAAAGGQRSAFAALHSIISGHGSAQMDQANQVVGPGQLAALAIRKALKLGDTQANIVQAHETSNGFLYLIDNVLVLPDDADYIVQTSSTPAISSTMSSLLGGHNSAILDFIQSLFSPSATPMSANTMIVLIGTLVLAIVVLALVALVLVARRRSQNKSLHRHQQLESGLTSSSSANSGSTSTTKSL